MIGAFISRACLVTFLISATSAELLKDLKAECTRDGIKVQLLFKEPFYGVAYSLGHFDKGLCQYIKQDAPISGASNYSFLIPAGDCGTIQGESKQKTIQNSQGMASSGLTVVKASYSRRKRETRRRDAKDNRGKEIFMENTLLIQQDPSIQESSDVAQKLRCVWQKEIHKPLTASLPFKTRTQQKPLTHSARNPVRYSTPELKGGFYGVVNPSHTYFRPKGQVQMVQPQKTSSWTRATSVPQTTFHESRNFESSKYVQLPQPLALVSSSSSPSPRILPHPLQFAITVSFFMLLGKIALL